MKSLVQQKFGAAAKDYASSSVHAQGETLARLVALTEPQPSWRVLDIATGAGHTALTFAPHVAKVTASDITDEMLAEARKLAQTKGVRNLKTVRAAAEDLPFPDMCFDLVTCRLAAHHFDDVTAFASEAYRVLMPGGRFALVDNISPDPALCPNMKPAILDALSNAYNAFEKLRDPSHWRCLGLNEWSALLASSGLDITHREWLDQDIAFDPWVSRMRCAPQTVARLRSLVAEEPLAAFLRPREEASGLVFTLHEGVIIASKPRETPR